MAHQPQNTPPGQMVDIGGFRLHAMLAGQGAPTVIFEPALGGFAQQYTRIHQPVSAFTRVLAYDRAGQGWSDTSPNPRTPAHLTAELDSLLCWLDLRPPYVLVGHSFGGLLSRIYAGRHPDDVAGMVLVDATDVDEYEAFGDIDKIIDRSAVGVRLMSLASKVGLGRALTKLSLGRAAKDLPPEELDAFLTAASRPRHHHTMLAEFRQHRHYFGSQSEVPRALGGIPLVVVTAGSSVSGSQKTAGLTADEINARHQRMQRAMVGLSARGEQVVVPGATHFSILFQPEHAACVVDAIRRVVEQARG